MLREFPPPPRAAEFSELIKKRLEDARAVGGTRETATVDWNTQQAHVEVIEVSLDGLYLNPGTHRIRAQRSHDPVRDALLEKEPWGAESQDYLRFLLQARPTNPEIRDVEFDNLKNDLQTFGQNEPGLVTRDGVLVNGNTRAVALRELGVQSMRVGVLPESFTWADVYAVELSLQLRQDQKRDYTFINRLLAMEEQAALGKTPEQIAKEFRIKTATYHQARWILSTIQDLNERSRSGGVALRLVDWEAAQESLKELQRLYIKLQNLDRDQAEILKEWRLAAILLDFSKTDIRHIDEEFLKQDYLARTLPASLAEAGAVAARPQSVAVPGLGLEVPTASSGVSAARALNDQILRSAAARNAPDLPDHEKAKAQQLFDEAKDAFDAAIEQAGRDGRVRKRKQLAPARLADACSSIEQCVVELVQARTSQSFDEEAFDEAVLRLRGSLKKLAQQAGRGIPSPGDGVSWLLAAVAAEGSQ